LSEEALGFALAYPAGWVAKELDYAGSGMPDDWPVVAGWQIMPAEIAAQMAAQSGPPDPNAPPLISPLQLEILDGDQSAFERVYAAPVATETAYYGANRFMVQQEEFGVTRYVYQPPLQPKRWIVLIDWVTHLPEREALAAQLGDYLPQILASIRPAE
jgi:hypothetical protein